MSSLALLGILRCQRGVASRHHPTLLPLLAAELMLDDSGQAASLKSEQRLLSDGPYEFYFKCDGVPITQYCIDNSLLGCAFEEDCSQVRGCG